MAQNKETNTTQTKKANNNVVCVIKKGTPMIVERVKNIPVVNFAVSMGFSQYDKLKSSHATVAQFMTQAESLASYFWTKVQPIVEKLQDPINRADQLACDTLDFIEGKLRQ